MKLRNKTTKNQKGFISTKILAASGFALTAALTGSFIYASLGVPSTVSNDLSSESGNVCVSAHWADDLSINSKKKGIAKGSIQLHLVMIMNLMPY